MTVTADIAAVAAQVAARAAAGQTQFTSADFTATFGLDRDAHTALPAALWRLGWSIRPAAILDAQETPYGAAGRPVGVQLVRRVPQ